MKVINAKTGEYIDRKKAYATHTHKANFSTYKYIKCYFNNVSEFTQWDIDKHTRYHMYSLCEEICGEYSTTLPKYLEPISKKYGYKTMYLYLRDNKDYISGVISKKNFNNLLQKSKYFSAIIQNAIPMYRPQKNIRNIPTSQEEEFVVKYSKKPRRKGLSEIENEILNLAEEA